MNVRSISSASLNMLRLALQVNFNAAVIVVLVSSLLSLAGNEFFFKNNSDLYGPLVNNLRFVLLYLILVQLAIYGFYLTSHNYAAILVLGAFLLTLVLSLEFYCKINQIEIDRNYQIIFVYAGLSHVLYAAVCMLRKN